jgi:hypothetical protein
MARFFVGQRVRVVGVDKPHNKYLIGLETRIIRFHARGSAMLEIHPIPDGSDGISLCNIVPILPSGHKPSEYANVHDLLDAMKRKQANPDEVAA